MSQSIQKQQPQAAAPSQPTLAQYLNERKAHLAKVLPKSSALSVDKLLKLALAAQQKSTALQECSLNSIFLCLFQCAELGLEPNTPLGQAYLIPFKGVCTLVIGYRGLIGLARRSGSLKQIEAHVVHERDSFKLRFGLEPILDHEPCLDGDPGAPRLAYCVAQLDDGARHVEVMTIHEVNRIRDRSPSAKSKRESPWDSDYEEMAKKTVARRACKWLPMSTELARAFEIEDEGPVVDVSSAGEVTALSGNMIPANTQTEKAKAMLKARTTIVDVLPGETEEAAKARVATEPDDSDRFAGLEAGQ